MATTRVGLAPMKAAQISKPGGDFELVEIIFRDLIEGRIARAGEIAAVGRPFARFAVRFVLTGDRRIPDDERRRNQ